MYTLCCQIQIDRLETLTEDRIVCLCHNLSDKMRSITFETGDDNGRYVNLFIDSDDAADAWSLIRTSLLSDRLIGVEMRRASIVTMTGQHGWDDYLLLHHFDQTQTLDNI